MRHYGTIAHWNEARKFGAILEEYSQKEVFAPLAAFDRTDPPPTVGERVSFEMTVGRRNRDEAADIRYMDRFADEEEDGFQAETSDSVKKTAFTAFIAGLIAFGGYYGYHYVAENSSKIIPHQQNEVIVKQVAEQIHADRQAWKAAVSGSGHGKAVKTENQPQEKAKADDSIGGRIMQLFNKESLQMRRTPILFGNDLAGRSQIFRKTLPQHQNGRGPRWRTLRKRQPLALNLFSIARLKKAV